MHDCRILYCCAILGHPRLERRRKQTFDKRAIFHQVQVLLRELTPAHVFRIDGCARSKFPRDGAEANQVVSELVVCSVVDDLDYAAPSPMCVDPGMHVLDHVVTHTACELYPDIADYMLRSIPVAAPKVRTARRQVPLIGESIEAPPLRSHNSLKPIRHYPSMTFHHFGMCRRRLRR